MRRNVRSRAFRTLRQNIGGAVVTAVIGAIAAPLSAGNYETAAWLAVSAALGAIASAIQNVYENTKREGPQEDS